MEAKIRQFLSVTVDKVLKIACVIDYKPEFPERVTRKLQGMA